MIAHFLPISWTTLRGPVVLGAPDGVSRLSPRELACVHLYAGALEHFIVANGPVFFGSPQGRSLDPKGQTMLGKPIMTV